MRLALFLTSIILAATPTSSDLKYHDVYVLLIYLGWNVQTDLPLLTLLHHLQALLAEFQELLHHTDGNHSLLLQWLYQVFQHCVHTVWLNSLLFCEQYCAYFHMFLFLPLDQLFISPNFQNQLSVVSDIPNDSWWFSLSNDYAIFMSNFDFCMILVWHRLLICSFRLILRLIFVLFIIWSMIFHF